MQSIHLSVKEDFESIADARVERTTLHKLGDILTIAICAVICGADQWVEMELFGKSWKDWLSGFPELPNGNGISYLRNYQRR